MICLPAYSLAFFVMVAFYGLLDSVRGISQAAFFLLIYDLSMAPAPSGCFWEVLDCIEGDEYEDGD